MTIRIDVPGIGQIVAENAATESTLRELVRVMGGRTGAGAAARAGSNRGRQEPSGVFRGIVEAGKALINATNSLSKQTIKLVSDFSDLGNSVTAAADVTASALNKIPIVGELLGVAFRATAVAAEDLARSFNSATSAGADFGGSVNALARSATNAGMTIQDFAALIQSNNGSLLAFGNNTTTGAKRFADLSKGLRDTGDDLYALGLSTRDINEGLMSYGNALRMQGLNENRNNRDLVEGSKKYLKEMDLLAKVTGEERKAKQQERERLLRDAQFQASMSGLNEDVRASFLMMMQSVPAEMQGFVKDLVSTGTATNKENQLLGSQMGETASLLSMFHGKMQRNEALTAEEMQLLLNKMKAEGKNLESIKQAAAASETLAGVTNSMASTQRIQTNGLLDSIAAQKLAAQQTDLFNKQVQQAQEQVAGISNRFKEALANSGLLPKLMDFFGMLSNIMIKYVIPVFSDYLVPAVMKISDFLMDLLVPAFELLGDIFSSIMPDINDGFGFLDRLLSAVNTAFKDVGSSLKNFYDKIFKGSSIFEKIGNAFKTAGDIFIGTIEFLGRIFGNLTDRFTDFSSSIVKMVSGSELFNKGMDLASDAMGDFVAFTKTILSREGADLVTQAIADFFNVILPDIAFDIKDWFADMFDDIQVMIYEWGGRLFGKGISQAEADRRKAERQKLDDDRNFDRAVAEMNLKNQYYTIQENQKQLEEERKQQKTSKKIHDQSAKMAGDTLKNTAKAISLNTTTSAGAIETLKQFAEQQGKTSGFKNADAAKETIGEAAKEAVKESKPATTETPSTEKPATGTTSTGRTLQAANQTSPAATQDQLNTLMTELVYLMRQNNQQNNRMMSGISSLSGNLFENVG